MPIDSLIGMLNKNALTLNMGMGNWLKKDRQSPKVLTWSLIVHLLKHYSRKTVLTLSFLRVICTFTSLLCPTVLFSVSTIQYFPWAWKLFPRLPHSSFFLIKAGHLTLYMYIIHKVPEKNLCLHSYIDISSYQLQY